MKNSNTIACVTGASGLVGKRIVECLLKQRFTVRILTRKKEVIQRNVEIFFGGLENTEVLEAFLDKAHLLFHCAAELKDPKKMWDVNVFGTEKLLRLASNSDMRYFCYISSAGVIGRTSVFWIKEDIDCNPQNDYERSKWAAEKLVAKGINNCKVVILRPTNIIDENNPGDLLLSLSESLADKFKMFLKGGEYAHMVYSEDVAAAALYFISYPINKPECFFVSYDHEHCKTFASIWSLCIATMEKKTVEEIRLNYLPPLLPKLFRLLVKNKCNFRNTLYSPEKLLLSGFKYPVGLEKAIVKVILPHIRRGLQ